MVSFTPAPPGCAVIVAFAGAVQIYDIAPFTLLIVYIAGIPEGLFADTINSQTFFGPVISPGVEVVEATRAIEMLLAALVVQPVVCTAIEVPDTKLLSKIT